MSVPSSRNALPPAASMDLESSILHEATPDDAESLTSRLDPDLMANDQTWPTEEEMLQEGSVVPTSHSLPDADVGTTPKRVKRVPRGTSAYQAAWIIDDDDDGESDVDNLSTDGEDISMKGGEQAGTELAITEQHSDSGDEDLVELTEDMESVTRKTEFEDMDMELESQQYVSLVNRPEACLIIHQTRGMESGTRRRQVPYQR